MPPTAAPAAKPEEKTAEQIAAEAAAAAASKPLSPEDQTAVNEFLSEVVGEKPPKKEEKKPDAKPAAAKPTTKPTVKKPTSKPTPAPAPAAAAVDVAELATAVGKSVAAEIVAARTPAAAADAPDALMGLTEKERRQIPIIERMEKSNPDRYKGLKDKYIANSKAVNEYMAKWEKENDGKEFDPEDGEHDAFFAKHSLDWDEDDETDARAEIIAENRIAEATRKTNEELEEFRNKDRAREQAPQIAGEAKTVDRKVFDLVGGDFAKILKADGTIDTEVIKKIEAKDPIAAEIVFPQVQNLNVHAQELIKIDRGLVKLDKANPMHNFLVNFAIRQEAAILALPKDKQKDKDGKKYVKSSEFHSLTPENRARSWTLTANELARLMAVEYGIGIQNQVANEQKKFERYNKQLGYVKGDAPKPEAAAPAAKSTPEVTTEPEEEVESPENTPARTAVAGQGDTPPAGKGNTGAFFNTGW